MTKRLYSTDQVLDALLSDDEDFGFDDQDEPMMAGSDDEFSDMEVVSDNDDYVDETPASAQHLQPPSPVDSPPSALSVNSTICSSYCCVV